MRFNYHLFSLCRGIFKSGRTYRQLFIAIALFSIFGNLGARARQEIDSTVLNDIDQTKATFDDNLDSLVNSWYVQHNATKEDLVNDSALNNLVFSNIPDSVFFDRLQRIPSCFKLTYNPIVRGYIEMYSQRKVELVQVMLGFSKYYFPIFDEIFDYYDVPNEIKYMSIIESALNPKARSRTRAIGLWQFMYGTGKLYGLEINSLVDERRDVIKATKAAARFSHDLYEIFGDWQLVVAAYNCGPANVNKAIRRAGGKKDFWEIYRYLPRETRGHVPAFIAATYVMNYYKEHNLIPYPISMPSNVDTIKLNKQFNLGQISDVLGIPLSQLREMNPQYIRDIIPARLGHPYSVILPVEYTSKFIDLEDSIYAYKKDEYFNVKDLTKGPTLKSSKNAKVKPVNNNYSAIYYTVKTNDNLGLISEAYKCSVNSLMDWNDLYTSRIVVGQKLIIYVPKQKAKGKQVTAEASKENSKANQSAKDNSIIYYTVKQGDTLWDIARLYPGVTGEDLCKWNNLASANNIKPGQQIKIIKM
jgi:membrane-bound lytic murein transglycosylase D